MPGPLTHFRSDPNRKKRGRGVYYHRGHGYFSKYSVSRDKKIIAKNPPQARKRYHHTGDVWASIWRAKEIGEKGLGGWPLALKIAMRSLATITQVPQPKLKIKPLERKGWLGYYRPVEPREIVVAKHHIEHPSMKIWHLKGYDPLETLFHEWGHHIHFMRRKPRPPMVMTKSEIENIARSFGRLYREKIRTKAITI